MLSAVHASAILRLCSPLPSHRARKSNIKSAWHDYDVAHDYLEEDTAFHWEVALQMASPSEKLLYEEWQKRDHGLSAGDICSLPVSKDVRKLCKETLEKHQDGNSLQLLLYGWT